MGCYTIGFGIDQILKVAACTLHNKSDLTCFWNDFRLNEFNHVLVIDLSQYIYFLNLRQIKWLFECLYGHVISIFRFYLYTQIIRIFQKLDLKSTW